MRPCVSIMCLCGNNFLAISETFTKHSGSLEVLIWFRLIDAILRFAGKSIMLRTCNNYSHRVYFENGELQELSFRTPILVDAIKSGF